MKKILFVIAMQKEATKIAKELTLKQITENQYSRDNITLIITGVGKQQTAMSLVSYLENNKENKPDIIINMGYAGSTNSKIGQWVNVNKSYNYEWNIPGEEKYTIIGYDKEKISTLDNANIKILPCYSAESFVTSTDIKEDVVFDMELHSIYMICCKYDIELISLKKVSDNLSLENYYENIKMEEVMELTSGLSYLKEIIM
ncbi:MAG: hypothetical protein U0O43_06710 [Clostridia bacterium]